VRFETIPRATTRRLWHKIPGAPNLMIAVLQQRRYIRQQLSKVLLPLQQRRRVGDLSVEVKQIEQEEDEVIGIADIRRLHQTERTRAVGPNSAKLAIKIRLLGTESGYCRHGL
jgi:hypothetical protein